MLPDRSTPPADLDPLAAVEEQLLDGLEVRGRGRHRRAASTTCRHWLPRTFGRLEAVDETTTRLVATTDEPEWYAAQLADLPLTFRLVGSPEVRAAMAALSRRLLVASASQEGRSATPLDAPPGSREA